MPTKELKKLAPDEIKSNISHIKDFNLNDLLTGKSITFVLNDGTELEASKVRDES
jgi:hypothetical protein